MKWESILQFIGQEPLFSTGLLLTAGQSHGDVERQLARWTSAGKLVKLRRGLYTLASPYQREAPHPFLVANRAHQPSYVSLQSALEYYGMIPEYVPAVTSVTTGRPGTVSTPLGSLIYRHVSADRFTGYRMIELTHGQTAFLALPEKALLDLIYLTPHADRPEYLEELRLQNLDQLDPARLVQFAGTSPKLLRALRHIERLRAGEEYELL